MPLKLDGTSGLSGVDGTSALPSVQGTDADTGIFFPAANTIAFSEGGAEVARIDSSGNVLVGRTTSTVGGGVKLDVAGAVNASSFLVNGAAVGGNYNLQVFTDTNPAGTTWTKPAGLKAVKVTVVGGGGGIATVPSPSSIRSAAGGGGAAVKYIPAPSIPGPITVTVGAGGGSTAPTITGGTSSFGSLASATGGSGGGTSTGGSGSNGTYNISGETGEPSFTFAVPPSTNIIITGRGGSSILGFGGTRKSHTGAGSNLPANAGSQYGGGASGAASSISTPGDGAVGGQGIVIVEEFY